MKRFFAFILALLCLSMPLTAFAKGDVKQVSEKAVYTNADTSLPYRLLLPDNYDENNKYPLIIYFHGAGERGDDNELQLANCVQYIYDHLPEECIIVAPQCPLENQWVDTPWGKGTYSTEEVPQSNEIHAAMELIGELKKTYSVDSDRVYAIGMSMGGYAVWDVMVRYNHLFAAAIPICAAGDASKAEMLKDTPLYVFHGAYDMVVPVAGSRDMVTAIRDAGGTVIEYTEYELGDHHVWDQALATPGIFDKLLKHKLSDRITISEPADTDSESTSDESETLNNSDETNEDEDNGSNFLTIALIVGGALVVIAVIVAVVVLIKKKK